MPERLKNFLEQMHNNVPSDADEIWKWLDGNPNAIDEMIAILAFGQEQKQIVA